MDDVSISRLRHLSPFVLRFGGTSQDYEQYVAPGLPPPPTLPSLWQTHDGCNVTRDKVASLVDFAQQVNASLVYGLNALLRVGGIDGAALDPHNGVALLNATRPGAVYGVSLGNEPSGWSTNRYSNMTARVHAGDFAILRHSMPDGKAPRLMGPDLYQPVFRDSSGMCICYM